MKRAILIILTLATVTNAFAQVPEGRMVETIKKDGYFFIPESALKDSVLAVVHQFYRPDKKIKNKKVFEFYWHSSCNDGSYKLTITPEQIYFSSGHDNPNPNYLFWVQGISDIQYRQIAKFLRAKAPKGFKDLSNPYPERYVFYDENYKEDITIPDDWTDEQQNEFHQKCDSAIRGQLIKIYTVFNSMIESEEDKLVVLSKVDMEKTTPKHFGYNKAELEMWVNMRVK